MRLKKIVAMCLIIFLVLLMIADHIRPLYYYNNIKKEYWNIKENLTEMYNHLISIEDSYVYIEKNCIIEDDINLTINSRETNYALNSESGKKIFDLGYYEFSKDNNGVRFYKYKDIHGTYGICRIDTTSYDYKDFLVLMKEIDDGWYFFHDKR